MMTEKIMLERFKHAIFTRLSKELIGEYCNSVSVDISTDWSFIEDAFVARIITASYGRMLKEKKIKYPATWWDAFKEQVLPHWLRERVKIDYITQTLTARECFPDIPIEGHRSVIYYNVE
jgi:hypothetical protein